VGDAGLQDRRGGMGGPAAVVAGSAVLGERSPTRPETSGEFKDDDDDDDNDDDD
jgi:hypothetical protein